MAKKTYAYVGNWHFKQRRLGITQYEYNEANGELKYIDNFFPNAAVGQTKGINWERGLLYLNNESPRATLLCAKIDPKTGALSLMNEVASHSTWPSWFCVHKSKKYGLVSAMSENDGKASLTVYSLEDDGSISDPVDWMTPHKMSKLHCCVPDPTGEMFVVIDREAYSIYTFALGEDGRLKLLKEVVCPKGSRPRYCAFHPTLPIFYTNNEGAMVANAWKYDVKTGDFERIEECRLLFEDVPPSLHRVQPSDILVDDEAKNLYVTVRGVEQLSVIALDEEGHMTLKQNVPTGGKDCRGFAIAPDGRYAFTQNQLSHDISRFIRGKDGCLTPDGAPLPGISPANMIFYSVEE